MNTTLSRRDLLARAARFFLVMFVLLAGMLFVSAGTLAWWNAWMFLATLILPMLAVGYYFLTRMPDLLERRLQTHERQTQQKVVMLIGYVAFLADFVVPGLDRRFGWTALPAWICIAADVLLFIGYVLTMRVLVWNRYASRIVEVSEEQHVIDTGPYARVRHPMYTALLLLYLPAPIALGSLWGLIPMALLPLILVLRIRDEEALLLRDLAGYREYTQRVRWHLLPGVW